MGGRAVLSEAWSRTRDSASTTVWAIVAAVAGTSLAIALLHQFDAGTVGVQVLLAVLIFGVVYLAAVVAIAVERERERDRLQRDFDVIQMRVTVTNTIRAIAADCRSELDKAAMNEEDEQKRLAFYAGRALSAIRSDVYANAARTREIEEIVARTDSQGTRNQLVELERLLRSNVYEGAYFRS